MKGVKCGDSIEGEKLGFQARKINVRPPRRDSNNRTLYGIKLSIFGLATVRQELAPKKSFFGLSNSLLDLEDEISGEALIAWSLKVIPDAKVSNATSSHKAVFTSSKAPTYATIEIGIREVMQMK